MNIELLITKSLSQDERSWTLTSRIGDMLEMAKKRFGEIHSDFFLLGIEFKDDGPRIQYQNPKYIIIHLTPQSLDDEFIAYYQLSHEVYHLLSPTGIYDPNNLEEGLATYFSKLYLDSLKKNVFNWENATKADSRYYNAYLLVDKLLQIDPDVIKTVREKYPTIKTSHLTIKEFEAVMGNKMPKDTIVELLKPFPTNKNGL